MTAPRFLSISEQVAAYLTEEIARGRWVGVMPGMNHLAAELGVNSKTADAALRLLEHAGVLAGRGAGHRRKIIPEQARRTRPLRIALLLNEPADLGNPFLVELRHALAEAGHMAVVAERDMTSLGMVLGRIRRLVQATPADAWVVLAGSRDLLEWFVGQPKPAFALFGRREGLPLAAIGPDKVPAMTQVARTLIQLGHRRIVLLARRLRRTPAPGRTEQAFLEALAAGGIRTGAYNLPDWEESADGFQRLLDSLTRVTPPTAIVADEAHLFIGALQYFARHRVAVPEQVSLVCTDDNPMFSYCRPSVAHIHWDPAPMVLRIARWAANIGRGRRDIRQTLVPARYVPGGTIGPAPLHATRGA